MINRNVKKILALTITLLIAAGFYLFKENTNIEAVDIQAALSEAESIGCMTGLEMSADKAFLQDKTQVMPDENKGVCYNNTLLPYDAASNTLYLSQTIDDDIWHGTLTSQIIGGSLYTLQDDNWSKKTEAIAAGHTFTIWLTTDHACYEYNLCVTGMPVIWINGSAGSGSQMVVFDPDEGEIVEVETTFRQKGGMSSVYPKKSYALKLKTQSGESDVTSLLGMCESSSWKLNSLYYDAERIREKVACQLWQEIDEANSDINEAGPIMRYVELIVNDSYGGIYTLVEPVYEDKLGLDDNDALYKTGTCIIPTNDEIQECIGYKNNIAEAVEIKYPDNIKDYESAWAPMIDYNSWVYEGESLDYEKAIEKVCTDNLYDYNIFIMSVDAVDNTYKNIYFTARVDDDGNSIMYLNPWDLDLTFQNTKSYTDYGNIYQVDSLTRLMELNPSQVKADYANRYFSYRDNILSTEHIIDLFEENHDYLLDTGAILREEERWPVCELSGLPINTDITELEGYVVDRMNWLDQYYSTLLQEAAE